MGEENNTALTLYINGEPCHIDPAAGLPEIAAMPTADLPAAFHGGMDGAVSCAAFALTALGEAIRRAIEAITPTMAAVAAFFAELAHTQVTFERAMAAAERERPKWVAIYRRTKKVRTRKKYQKRIMRWYLEEVEQNE